MDQRIIALESSTFSGRRLNRQQIADIQETVALVAQRQPQRAG